MKQPLGLSYTEAALSSLSKIPKKFREQIVRKIAGLTSNPTPPASKQLVGVKEGDIPVRRLRSGDYRILYALQGNPTAITILDIGDRKDVYKR